MQIASELLDRYKNADQIHMNEILAGDEPWIHLYEPEGTEKTRYVW